MPRSTPEQVTVEKSPSYFITEEVPQRIHDMSSTVKLLLVVRDPVQRAISDHTQSLSKGKTRTLEQRIMKETDPGPSTRELHRQDRVIRETLSALVGLLPPISDLDRERRRPRDEAGRRQADVQEFLNLEKIVNEDYFFFNETKGFPCLKRDPHEAVPKCLDGSKGATPGRES
ncbi:hypothetical protein BSL78_15701 [Apostichopus japonicus]|uniref:Sulfotransferase n=1 Tax=Stichopus japonicus TaxID=307972 RepID=A0A2G8KHK4_STIJA|nr:hypothetical protein BSL78_15701 [Apostichopus japonicus]